MKRTLGIIGSVGLHLVLLFSVVSCDKVSPPPPPKVAVDIGQTDTAPKRLRGEDVVGEGLACTDKYKGIGVHINYGSGAIIDIGPGTPAEKAGMQVGDILLDPDALGPNRYEPNTLVKIPIERNGKRLVLIIPIGTICNE